MQDKIIDEVEIDENVNVMEKVKLDDVLKYEQPTKYIVKSANYSADFKTPVLTAGKTFVLGHTDETSGVFENFPVIIFDDFTTAFHYVDFPFKVKSSAMKILKNVEGKADLKYLFYKMQTISIDRDLHKRYWISKYSQLNIPLPPLPTQQKIAAILDKADELRQYNKQLIEKYEALTQSLFLDMFGDPVKNEKVWEKMVLGKIAEMASGSTPSRINENNFIGDIPWVKTTEVNGRIIYKTLEKISKEALKNSSCKLYPKDSIVIAMYGQGKTRGQIGILGIEAATNQACCVLKPSNKMNFKFLYNTLSELYDDLRSLGRGGNQPNLNLGLLKNYEVINPPIELQIKFAERVQMIEAQKQQALEALEKSEALFQGLLQRAFKGELN
jgi:type I restriction enzyme S subunit